MCTVSFYKDAEKLIITSNRDEHINRPLAIAPEKFSYNNKPLYFPKDPQAGGTWFVVKPDGSIFVLLNGADKKHVHNPPYRKSRGIILLELAASDNFNNFWSEIDLENIEPFTVIVLINNKLLQVKWNGEYKNYLELDGTKPQIWSSCTLYEPEIIQERKRWFNEFLTNKNSCINADDLIKFHKTTKNQDKQNGLLINRNKQILTKNVTQVLLEKNLFRLSHFDLITNIETFITENIQ